VAHPPVGRFRQLQLALGDGPLLETAKLAVIVGSALATLFALGYGSRLRR